MKALLWVVLCLLALPSWGKQARKPVTVDAAYFEAHVQPLLQKRCLGCHGADAQLSHFDLRSRLLLIKGGTRGAAVVPGSADKSLLFKLLSGSRAPLMPPGGKLPASELAILKTWIDGGAPWGKTATLGVAEKQVWWSFAPVRSVVGPNTVDSFVRTKLKLAGLAPSPKAPRRVLIRRIYADLWGLPPAPEAVEAFVNDPDPRAYEKLVNQLLASPRYGERWGRHWLDLARYADSGGFEGDKDRPLMWRYRDWVIDAFNNDLPYDEFVRQQLAGDELKPADKTAWIATGFLACGPVDIVENNARTRANELDDLVATTSSVVLGLTVGCARCHDHKYDPVKMTDYYRLAAIFAPPERREIEISDGKAQAVSDKGATFGPSFLLRRGDAYQPDREVKPGFIASLPGGDVELATASADPTNKTTGRRAALARWLTAPENPLTARVLVNRVWRQHFGRGIVNTTSNFGLNGELPSHPELLDWLTEQFVASGWSLKALHKLIVLSETYQQASDIRTQALQTDPQNKLLWRMPVRRLEGEAVRDGILAVAGTLNLERGGPAVYPPVDPSLRADTFQGINWPEGEDSPKTWRRSVYVKVKRSLLLPQLEVFDCPEITYTVAQRNVTTTPLQALTLLNDPLILRQASLFAERLKRDRPGDTWAQVDRAYRLCFGRPATDTERKLSLSFLKTRTLAEFCHTLLNLNEFVYVP